MNEVDLLHVVLEATKVLDVIKKLLANEGLLVTFFDRRIPSVEKYLVPALKKEYPNRIRKDTQLVIGVTVLDGSDFISCIDKEIREIVTELTLRVLHDSNLLQMLSIDEKDKDNSKIVVLVYWEDDPDVGDDYFKELIEKTSNAVDRVEKIRDNMPGPTGKSNSDLDDEEYDEDITNKKEMDWSDYYTRAYEDEEQYKERDPYYDPDEDDEEYNNDWHMNDIMHSARRYGVRVLESASILDPYSPFHGNKRWDGFRKKRERKLREHATYPVDGSKKQILTMKDLDYFIEHKMQEESSSIAIQHMKNLLEENTKGEEKK